MVDTELVVECGGRRLCHSSFGGGGGGGGESERVDGTGGVFAGGKVPVEGGWVWEFRLLEREWEEKRVHELPDGWLP